MFFLSGSTSEEKVRHIIHLYRQSDYQQSMILRNEEEIADILRNMLDLTLRTLPIFAMQSPQYISQKDLQNEQKSQR